MSYEQKYLKYKQKYLELKGKLNINSDTKNTDQDTQFQLSETPENNMKGGDFWNFLNKPSNNSFNIKNTHNKNTTPQNEVPETAQTEQLALTDTPNSHGAYSQLPIINVDGTPNLAKAQSPSSGTPVIQTGVEPHPVNPVTINDVKVMPPSPPQVAQSKYSIESDKLSDIENTTDIENIFKQLGGKRKSRRSRKKSIDDSSDIFGSSDSISIDDSNSSSDFSVTPAVPSDTNPFEETSGEVHSSP
jgi:hypothetical protein